jgi:hypothetical protein
VEIGQRVPGAARLQLADGIPLLRPEEQVFTAMLEGWRNQQMARNLSLALIIHGGCKVELRPGCRDLHLRF